MPEAPDLLRDTGNLQGGFQALRVGCYRCGAQRKQDLVHTGAVFGNQGTLLAALISIAKHIKCRAAQAFQSGQHLEGGKHEGAKFLLLQLALVVLFSQQGRCQVVVELEVTLKHGVDLGVKTGIGVQAGHFILVFVGHEFEEVAGHGFGKGFLGGPQGFFGSTDFVHKHQVFLGVSRVLVGREVVHAFGDHVL